MASSTPRIDSLEQSLIVNGNFDIAQRGNTVTVPHNLLTYGPDRFAAYKNVAGVSGNNAAIDRIMDAPTLAQSGAASTFSFRYQGPAATASIGASDQSYLRHIVEGFDYASIHGLSVRLQFWIKASLTGVYPVFLQNSAVNRSYVTTVTINSSGAWEQKILDITLDSAGTWLFDNGAGLKIGIGLGTGSNFSTSTLNTWQTGDFKTVPGAVNFYSVSQSTIFLSQVILVSQNFLSFGSLVPSLPFKRAGKTVQQELGLCQRYYWRFNNIGFNLHIMGMAESTGTNMRSMQYRWPVPMRTTPSLSYTDVIGNSQKLSYWRNGGSGINHNDASSVYTPSDEGFYLVNTGGNYTSGNTFVFVWGSFAADAELQ